MALSAAGAALGLGIAGSAVERLSTFVPGDNGVPVTLDLSPDWRVLGYMIVLSLVAAVAFALPPALQSTRWNVWGLLRASETAVIGGASRLRAALTVAQVALCVVLLAGSGLLVRSLYLLESFDTGVTTEQVTLASLDTELSRSDAARSGTAGPVDAELRRQHEDEIGRLYTSVAERVAAVPGVESAALATTVPLSGGSISLGKLHGGVVAEESAFQGSCNVVTPGYFETMGIPILQGRPFSTLDSEHSPPVAIVNERLARRLWPAGDAVGRIFRVGGSAGGSRDRHLNSSPRDHGRAGVSGVTLGRSHALLAWSRSAHRTT